MIRRMRPGDLDQILQLWFRANRQAHFYLPKEYFEKHMAPVRQALLHSEVACPGGWRQDPGIHRPDGSLYRGNLCRFLRPFPGNWAESFGGGKEKPPQPNAPCLSEEYPCRPVLSAGGLFHFPNIYGRTETGLAEWAMEWRKNPAPHKTIGCGSVSCKTY